ncbi:hypothetical protein [Treponema sp. R80B11-R83G3]
MKKLQKLCVLVLIVGLVVSFAGCGDDEVKGGDEYAKYYEGSYRNNVNGSVEVVNNTSYDMLLFSGSAISINYIVGGVRAFSTNTVNFSTEADYTVGGYKVIHAVKEFEFKANGDKSRIDNSAMITYRDGAKFRTNIVSTTDGAFQYTVHNMNSQYALELRKDSPEGEKVAYLVRAEKNRVIHSPSKTPMTLFPVWIAFNNVTKTIVPFSPSDAGDSWEGEREVQPKSPTEDVPTYRFPDSNIDINFNINFSFATIQVRNNAGRDVVFRIANQEKFPQSGYKNITSGTRESYEIISDGEGLDLNLSMQNGAMKINVRFEAAPDVLPVLENGYVYSVNLQLVDNAPPSQASSYRAWLVKGAALDKNDLLVSASN